MGMISNYTRRSTGVLEQYFEDYFGKTAHVILFIWEIKSHFQPITIMEVQGTTMSCQPGVVSDPERTLNQDFASISVPLLPLSEPEKQNAPEFRGVSTFGRSRSTC
jgi:hypothetical protein